MVDRNEHRGYDRIVMANKEPKIDMKALKEITQKVLAYKPPKDKKNGKDIN